GPAEPDVSGRAADRHQLPQTAGSAQRIHGMTFTIAAAVHRTRRNRAAAGAPHFGWVSVAGQNTPYADCGCTCCESISRTAVIVPSVVKLYPVRAAPPIHTLAGAIALPHGSGVNDVPVEAATSPSISWQITGTAVPDAPSNDTPQPSSRISCADGMFTCSTVFVVAAASATTTVANGVVVARGAALYSDISQLPG